MGDQPAAEKRRILMAVDDTEATERARDWTAKNLVRPGDEVHFLHVVAPADPEIILYTPSADPAVEAKRVRDAAEYIDKHFVPNMPGASCQVEVTRTQDNAENVGKVLCDRAKDLNATALVMASHNTGAMHRLFLGSASQYCTRNCSQPVVIVH